MLKLPFHHKTTGTSFSFLFNISFQTSVNLGEQTPTEHNCHLDNGANRQLSLKTIP